MSDKTEITNRLLSEILKELRKPPVELYSNLPQYTVRTIKMDTANVSPGIEMNVSGNSIIFYSDALLDNCFLRVQDPVSDAIPLIHANPYYHSKGFDRFYVETDAQSGKSLILLIQRGTTPGSNAGEMAKVGVYSQSAWAVRQGINKIFYENGGNVVAGDDAYVIYTPPTGKAFYIDYFTASMHATNVADADLNQIAYGYIKDDTSGDIYAAIAGNGGWAFAFPNPIKIPAGHQVTGFIVNTSGHTCMIRILVSGYELNE